MLIVFPYTDGMKKHAFIIFILIALVSIAAYISMSRKESYETKVGVIGPFTGIVASFGEEMKKGIQAEPVGRINYVFEDDACEASKAVSSFKKLVDLDKAKIIIGPACGSPQEAIAPVAKKADIIVLLPSAASAGLFEASEGKIYNMQSSLEDEARYLADSTYEAGHRTVALVTYENAFSKTMSENFKKRFKGSVVEIVFSDNESDVSTGLAKIKNDKIDAVVVMDIAFFLGKGLDILKRYDIKVPVYSTYATELPAIKSLVTGVQYSFPQGIDGNEGAIRQLSAESASLAASLIEACDSNTACMRRTLDESGKFDSTGISKRGFLMKQISQ